MKRTVTLDIAGARYRLSTDADEGHLKGLASIVNDRIAQLGPKAQRSAAPAQLLAVVALGLVEDLKEAERQRAEIEGLARQTISRAIERIDLRLSEDAELARRATHEEVDDAFGLGSEVGKAGQSGHRTFSSPLSLRQRFPHKNAWCCDRRPWPGTWRCRHA